MRAKEISQWFRATPDAFIETELVLMVGRDMIKEIKPSGRRAVSAYYLPGEWESR